LLSALVLDWVVCSLAFCFSPGWGWLLACLSISFFMALIAGLLAAFGHFKWRRQADIVADIVAIATNGLIANDESRLFHCYVQTVSQFRKSIETQVAHRLCCRPVTGVSQV
jgi:hypothetical protein